MCGEEECGAAPRGRQRDGESLQECEDGREGRKEGRMETWKKCRQARTEERKQAVREIEREGERKCLEECKDGRKRRKDGWRRGRSAGRQGRREGCRV